MAWCSSSLLTRYIRIYSILCLLSKGLLMSHLQRIVSTIEGLADVKQNLVVLSQVKGELAEVQNANEQSPAIEDSFARMGYSREAEQAVNEQIK